jgi:hypothetical protein
MINIDRAMRQDRLMNALTGLTAKEFQQLLPTFTALLHEEAHRKPRQRKFGGGSLGALEKDPKQKLFFILFYAKVYPTYDVAGFMYDVDRSRPCKWMKKLLPVLEKSLGRQIVLPVRRINSVEEFFRLFPGAKDVFIDGTERPIPRPKKAKQQKKNYSGKKKRHTRKNMIWCDEERRILLVSPTKAGTVHDKRLHDKAGGLHGIPDDVHKWLDTGFLGVAKDGPNVHIPKKRSKLHPLTDEDRENNRVIAHFRIVVEHAIRGFKRFRCTTDPCRNQGGIDDQLIRVSAGLWNLHLACA